MFSSSPSRLSVTHNLDICAWMKEWIFSQKSNLTRNIIDQSIKYEMVRQIIRGLRIYYHSIELLNDIC